MRYRRPLVDLQYDHLQEMARVLIEERPPNLTTLFRRVSLQSSAGWTLLRYLATLGAIHLLENMSKQDQIDLLAKHLEGK